jgi:hypothetical protein
MRCTILLLGALLFCPPSLAASASSLDAAIENGNPQAVRQALRDNASYLQAKPLASSMKSAIEMLRKAPPGRKEAARGVILALADAGAPLDVAFTAPLQGPIGTPVTWVSRIPGERNFVQALLRRIRPDKRCDVISEMIYGGTATQWAAGVAGIATVPARERATDRCGDLFIRATEGASPREVPGRVQDLFVAGLLPTPAAAARVVRSLPSSDAARQVLARILAVSDPDRPVRDPYRDHTAPPTTLFAMLLHATLERSASALQADLMLMRAWPIYLEKHPPAGAACNADMIRHADEAWKYANMDAWAADARSGRLALLRTSTSWLIDRCDPSVTKDISEWAEMIRAGSGDLVARAADRSIPFDNQPHLVDIAVCREDARLFLRLMKDARGAPTLDTFIRCLRAPEVPSKNGGDTKILRWLLDHGADASAPVEGAAPVAIAAWFDRDDVVAMLRKAGARPARLPANLRNAWLKNRLDQIAGFAAPDAFLQDDTEKAEGNPESLVRAVDLNADGRPEFFTDDGICGNANCGFAVAAYHDRRWRIVLSDGGDAKILSTRHQGWRDISVSSRASAAEYDMTIYHYNGWTYRPAICKQYVYDGNSNTPTVTEDACTPS